ncbi:hypothetical protein F2Q68_00044769 [Brassica cretica]|uniref:Uncharacterized protein n=1 Tax=Brassica cretica TaxID=69181 RepID=A0A8S9LQB8_BRACR|nr:hypothetical protein F2Q68_00044769 [Brassica cretica]
MHGFRLFGQFLKSEVHCRNIGEGTGVYEIRSRIGGTSIAFPVFIPTNLSLIHVLKRIMLLLSQIYTSSSFIHVVKRSMQNYSKLKKSVDYILALEKKLQNASNENAKLRLMQKEDGKLSRRMESKFSPTQNLADQLTENLQHLTSQVQEENSFGVGQLLPYQILSKDGKPYIMNCETKVFAPEEITDMVLTKVKEGRRVCMPPPPVPVFEDSSSDDTYSVPKKKGRLVGLGRRTRSVPPSSAPPPFVDPEVLTAQLKDKDDRISLLETQMAAQQAGYEAQKRLNQQMMEMMQRMYPNEVDVVLRLPSLSFHDDVSKTCIEVRQLKKHLITASYVDDETDGIYMFE